MRTIGREARKQSVSELDALKAKLSVVQAENEALKKTIKKLEAKQKKSVKTDHEGEQAETDPKTVE